MTLRLSFLNTILSPTENNKVLWWWGKNKKLLNWILLVDYVILDLCRRSKVFIFAQKLPTNPFLWPRNYGPSFRRNRPPFPILVRSGLIWIDPDSFPVGSWRAQWPGSLSTWFRRPSWNSRTRRCLTSRTRTSPSWPWSWRRVWRRCRWGRRCCWHRWAGRRC